MLMRLLDEYLHLTRRCLLNFDADDALLSPEIDFLTNFVFANVIRPADAIVRRRADVVLATKRAEVWTRREQSWPDRFTRINSIALRDDTLGIRFTGRPGRCDTVCQKDDAVVNDFFHTAVIDEVEVVVRVHVDHARQYRVGFGQVDNVGGDQDLLLDIGIDFHNLAVLYDDAGVRSAIVTNAVEQPTAANNQLSILPLGPFPQR